MWNKDLSKTHISDHCRNSVDNKSGTGAGQLNMFPTQLKEEDFGYLIYSVLIFVNVDD